MRQPETACNPPLAIGTAHPAPEAGLGRSKGHTASLDVSDPDRGERPRPGWPPTPREAPPTGPRGATTPGPGPSAASSRSRPSSRAIGGRQPCQR